jgi:hypothetical protein
MSIYIENFESNADIIKEYKAPADALDGATVYLAWYGYGSYSGDSLVIFEKDSILYEVNGGHCSCMGLVQNMVLNSRSTSITKHGRESIGLAIPVSYVMKLVLSLGQVCRQSGNH